MSPHRHFPKIFPTVPGNHYARNRLQIAASLFLPAHLQLRQLGGEALVGLDCLGCLVARNGQVGLQRPDMVA
jgi:hypothetical protein